jgi:hypothetical protein
MSYDEFSELDWATVNPHLMSDPVTRLANVERDVQHINEEIHGDDGLSKRLRDVEKTVWKASGFVIAINFIVILIVEYFKK